MKRKNRDFDYMQRKRLDEEDAAYNVRFERDRKEAMRRKQAQPPNLWGDKFASDLRHLAALGIISL